MDSGTFYGIKKYFFVADILSERQRKDKGTPVVHGRNLSFILQKNPRKYVLDKFRTLLNFGHQKFRTFLISDKHLSVIKNVRNFW